MTSENVTGPETVEPSGPQPSKRIRDSSRENADGRSSRFDVSSNEALGNGR